MSVQFDKLGDVKPKVTAGGKDKTKFVPNLNVSFFDDEFYFNLNRKDKVIKNEKAATANGKTSLGGIDTDIWYIDDKGRFKWDIEFTSRPAVNSWTWELKHTKGIEFYHQPALTAEEIADGCERPEEVVGSYAVYCNKAHNKYKTGKLCHIYRPFCYDAKGKTIYADLNIADGQLIITIDETWLDNAAYPVRLDPTIGYTTAGGSLTLPVQTVWARGNLTMPEAGTASKIYVYARLNTGNSHDMLVGYYDNSSGNPDTLIDGNKAISVTSETAAWYSVGVSGSLASGSIYYPAALYNTSTEGWIYCYYDEAGSASGDLRRTTSTVSTMPGSFGTVSSYSAMMSLYLEYAADSEVSGNSYYYQQQQM